MASTTCLRAAVHQLSITPTKELPFIASYVASTLSDCGAILSAPDNQKPSPGGNEVPLLVQKLKTRITSLLQDRSPEGRWTAVILVKSVVEAGQWEILRGCEPWVRGLLGILGKPDPSTTKKLCIITLTRIFLLTHRYQTLVREITTPTLPSFITACLNLISSKPAGEEARKLKLSSGVLEPVLCSFIKLIPNHPATFRPFSSQIHDLLLPLLDSARPQAPAPDSTVALAHRLFISLHHCAPRNTSGEEWLKACQSTILSIHRTGNFLFRAITEPWEPVDPVVRETQNVRDYRGPAGDVGPDALGLQSWTGIHEGSRKMTALLNLLSHFILMPTSSTVSIPLGSITDLTSRLSSLTIPDLGVDVSNMVNHEVGRDERESLWSELPAIHVAVLDLLRTLIEALGCGSISVAQNCIEQALCIFEAENFNRSVRTATYRLLHAILPVIGYSLSKSVVTSIAPAIRECCRDLQTSGSNDKNEQQQLGSSKTKPKGPSATSNADAFLNIQPKNSASQNGSLSVNATATAASELLYVFLSYTAVNLIPSTLRAEIDRTSILIQHRQAMLASVLNPVPGSGRQRSQASILPFLARSNPSDPSVEGLLRPRMPVLMIGGAKGTFDLSTRDNEPELHDVQMAQDEVVDYGAATQDGATSFSSGYNVSDSSVETISKSNKRVFENGIARVDERGCEGNKKARTESHQASRVKAAGLNQGMSEFPLLKPAASGNSNEQRSTALDVSLLKNGGEDSIIPPTTVEGQITSELKQSEAAPQRTVTVEGDEESDDEIPELNMEPDTDEDDDDMVE
ncbi:hypothetical protein VTO42DRAFT_817 [Malbranchea cinnamomea]